MTGGADPRSPAYPDGSATDGRRGSEDASNPGQAEAGAAGERRPVPPARRRQRPRRRACSATNAPCCRCWRAGVPPHRLHRRPDLHPGLRRRPRPRPTTSPAPGPTGTAASRCWWPAGWSALPVPLLLIWAPTWGWVVAANVLLGINQGLTWSTTVIMKIDLVGPRRRGLAMGLNEAAGYVRRRRHRVGHRLPRRARTGCARHRSCSASRTPPSAWACRPCSSARPAATPAYEAATHRPHRRPPRPPARRPHRPAGLRPDQLPRAGAVLGQPGRAGQQPQRRPGLGPVPAAVRRRRALRGPHRCAGRALPRRLGARAAASPAPLSDRSGRKWLIAAGMWLQAAGPRADRRRAPFTCGRPPRSCSAPARPWSTRPCSPRSATSPTPPGGPGRSGVYRLWRDGGFAVGALLAGILADLPASAPPSGPSPASPPSPACSSPSGCTRPTGTARRAADLPAVSD